MAEGAGLLIQNALFVTLREHGQKAHKYRGKHHFEKTPNLS
jgi:hypothetical protein